MLGERGGRSQKYREEVEEESLGETSSSFVPVPHGTARPTATYIAKTNSRRRRILQGGHFVGVEALGQGLFQAGSI